jgi:uncharacterized protein (DUF885 family)
MSGPASMRRAGVAAAAFASVLAAAGCTRQAPAPQSASVSEEQKYVDLEHEYVVTVMKRFPVVATYLGGAAFDPSLAAIDGQLRNYSEAALAMEDADWTALRAQFDKLDPAQLSPRRRIDRTVALAQIDFLLHQHHVLEHQQRALDSFVDEPFRGVDWQIQGMTETGTGTRGTDEEWQNVIARTRAIPAYMESARAQLSAGVRAGNTPDWRVLMQFGLQSTAADAEYFSKTLPALAASNISPARRDALLADLTKAGQDAGAAYTGLRDFIAQTFFADPAGHGVQALKPDFQNDRFALGEERYDWALRNNLRLDTTAAQLYEQSWSSVEATRAAMIELARTIAASHKWKVRGDGPAIVLAVFDRLSENAPKNDDEMIDAYRKTGVRLVDYARRTGLFDVPADYRLEVTVTPPPLRASIEGAAYYPAPAFKTAGVGRFYVTPTGNDQAALRQEHNLSALPDLAAHEGFPGHDWHYKVMTQHRNEISPVRWLTPGAVEDSSSMWEDSMAAEGWALYSEALLAEPQPGAPHGFYAPEEHLYQLRGQLYRDLRVRIDTGIHTGRLSFEDAVTLFSEVVDFRPGSCTDPHALHLPAKRASCDAARGAITRYSRWPTQAITYRMGKDQILALRSRAQAELGAKFSAKRFHMEFMKQGTIPAGYFAGELLSALAKP